MNMAGGRDYSDQEIELVWNSFGGRSQGNRLAHHQGHRQGQWILGEGGTHSTRKTLARKVFTWSKDIRVAQRTLGHRNLASEVWTAFRSAAAA
jgi:site-specific recombinase XerC